MLPITILENDTVKLSPLMSGDWKLLTEFVSEKSIWTAFPNDLSSEAAFETWMEERVALSKTGHWYPFLVTDKHSGKAVGMSCYLNVDEPNLVIEIGGTWYAKPFQGTAINPNCKLLLMTYAFETLGFERLEYKTDALNARSRSAILKLGAKMDGILRSNRIVQNGRRRDTVYFSILKSEWPDIKSKLEHRISQY